MSTTQSFKSAGETLMYIIFYLVAQTFFYGLYVVLAFLSTRILWKQELKGPGARAMFYMILFMCFLSTAYWAYSIADVADRTSSYIGANPSPLGIKVADHDEVSEWSPLADAIIQINYVLSDGVVVWRARVTCRRNLQGILWVSIIFLVLTAISVFSNIGFEVAAFLQSPIANFPKDSFLSRMIDILQILVVSFSLTSNISATAAVGVTAWRHRETLRAVFAQDQTTRTASVQILVAESGVLYMLSMLTALLVSLSPLSNGTFENLYIPLSVHLAGAYPSIVVLLRGAKRSLTETIFRTESSQSKALEAGGSVYTSPTSTVNTGNEPLDIVGNGIRRPISLIVTEAGARSLSRFSDDSFS